jgi:hypothetical protein
MPENNTRSHHYLIKKRIALNTISILQIGNVTHFYYTHTETVQDRIDLRMANKLLKQVYDV